MQNLFISSPEFINISRNSHYLFLTKSPRDKSQISTLAKQISPGNNSYVTESYKDATKKPYGYLLLDFTQKSEEKIRLRTNIFPSEAPQKVYAEKSLF